jgi:glycosyltransferase involved in cell wall biosynthesis
MKVPLRVAFDGRTLASPAGGVRRYVHELFTAMQGVADVQAIAVGAPSDAAVPPGIDRGAAGPSLPTNVGWSLTGLPVGIWRAAPDVVHAPAYTAPLWGRRPLVVTIHDVSYARHPEWYPYASDPARQAFYRASARRADRIITDSAFSRDEIVAAYGIDRARIDVVPLGVNPRFTPHDSIEREPVVLHVGDLHPRRNLSMLLDVVLALRQTSRECGSLRLVLAGTDRGLLQSLLDQARDDGEALLHVGTPGDAELLHWYRRAAVFAYPSRYEGFGLPLLEAMACGTPAVASTSGSLPEVGGDATLTADADDPTAWREAIQSIVTNEDLARALSSKGRSRSSAFTWDATARATVAVYRRALQDRRS